MPDFPQEPDFVLGPLTFVALGAFAMAARRRQPVAVAVAAAALALEFAWPSYQQFKRRRLVPKLARYAD